ncbi:MAG: P-loop NTPase [Elusimicrobiaceae bacterium]|nr:P-loop NTPase [Elusimicrobiaceae bacterium]
MKLDPRACVVQQRLAGIKTIIAVTGWKGGIGKSSAACALAMAFRELGYRTGLLDLDLTGASDHIILNARNAFPEEIKGLKPPLVEGIAFMSLSFFTAERAAPLRGADASSAILELLAVTSWGELDFLVIDMPPGISDAALDSVKYFRRAKLLPVTTPSALARQSLARAAALFGAMGLKPAGIIENFTDKNSEPLPAEFVSLAKIPHDSAWDASVGNPAALRKTVFYEALRQVARQLAN